MRLPHPFLDRVRTRAADRRCAEYVEGRRNALKVETVAIYLAAQTGASVAATTLLVNLAISVAVSYAINAAFAPRPGTFNQEAQDRMLTVRQPAASHDIVFGEVRKGGVFALLTATHNPEDVLTTLTEKVTIPAQSPYTITVRPDDVADWSHKDAITVRLLDYNRYTEEYDRTDLTEVASSPASTQFSVVDATGAYTFNEAQAGRAAEIVFKAKTDTKVSRYLHALIVLAGHECEEIGDMYFNGKLVPLDANGEATGLYAGHVFVSKHLGTDDQTVDTELQKFLPSWGANQRGRGICYAYVRFLRKLELFPNGVPNITFMVKGYKPYDPRTASSTWSPNVALLTSAYLTNTRFGLKNSYATEIDEAQLTASANIDDEEVLLSSSSPTAQFTANADTDTIGITHKTDRLPQTGDGLRFTTTGTLPAGLATGTTRYARRVSNERFTLHTSLAGAYANTGKVNITDAGSGTHTLTPYSEPRYSANGVIPTSEKKVDILGRLKVARCGHIVRVGGKWKIRGGAYIAPELSFDEDGARGDPAVQTLRGRRELFNGVKGLYSSPDNDWQPSDFPPVQVPAYVAEDEDEELWLEVDYPLTSRASTAQRISKALLERVRRQISVVYPMKLGAYRVEAPETIQLSDTMFGWTDKVFEVASGALVMDQDGEGNGVLGVDWALQEIDENVWDWNPEEDEEPTARSEASTLPNPFDVAPPGIPTVTEELYQTIPGGGVKAKAIVSIYPSPDAQVRDYEFQWKLTTDTRWQKQAGVTDLDIEIPDIAPGTYLFRARAFNHLGGASVWAQVRREISGLAARPSTPVIVGIQPHGNGLLMTLEPATELDVLIGGRWVVRYDTDTVTPSWETSTSVGQDESYPGGSAILALPLKAGTYLVKKEDSGGRQSETAAEIVVPQSSVSQYSEAGTTVPFTSPADISGSTNLVAVGGGLKLKALGSFDDIPDFDSVSSVDGYGGIYSSGSWDPTPGGSIGTGGGVESFRVTTKLVSLVYNDLDNIDERSGDSDDWHDFDGAGGGSSADAWVEIRMTDDGVTFTDWVRVDCAEFEFETLEWRIQLRSYDPAYNIAVESLSVRLAQIV